MPIPGPGEALRPFRCATSTGELAQRDDFAGRFTTFCFFGSMGVPEMAEMVRAIAGNGEIFDGLDHQFVGVSIDPDDAERVPDIASPAARWLWDFDRNLSEEFGALEEDTDDEDIDYQPLTVMTDPNLRVIAAHKIDDAANHAAMLQRFLSAFPTMGPPRAAQPQAPVLAVPLVFEMEFCRRLIEHFQKEGGKPSGILEDIDGTSVLTMDETRKRRRDLILGDQDLRKAVLARLRRRLLPEITKAFQFEVTRLERTVIGHSATGDFHKPHRDNASFATAHRRFAITIPLNAEEYKGGQLRFPEYGSQLYHVPSGCALVHSCSLLHEVTPIREGDRYAFLPVVYNEAANAVREKNQPRLAPGIANDRREVPD